MSVITDVNGVAVKMTTMCVVAIGWDAIAVVSARGTVDGHGLITSGARKGHGLETMREGGGFATAQAERGGGGAEECGQRMQDAKKVDWSPTSYHPRS